MVRVERSVLFYNTSLCRVLVVCCGTVKGALQSDYGIKGIWIKEIWIQEFGKLGDGLVISCSYRR